MRPDISVPKQVHGRCPEAAAFDFVLGIDRFEKNRYSFFCKKTHFSLTKRLSPVNFLAILSL
jgi:hypothetical protein